MASTIAFIAHDRKKDELVDLINRFRPVFARYHLIATGTTGQRIQDATGLSVERMLSGPMGGDAQIAARVTNGDVKAVFFLVDPLYAQPHEPDLRALLRICEVYNVPIAPNLASAEAIAVNIAKSYVAHLIYNPISGQGDAQQHLTLIRQMLEPHMHLKVRVTTTDIGAEEWAQEAVDEGAQAVIASGGDGTVSAVAGALLKTGIPLGVIPRGTANAFAATLGISTTVTPIRTACDIILNGFTRTVDAALCNGMPMILLAGVGFEAETVERACREMKDRWGVLAYLMAGWQQLNEQTLFDAEIEIDGEVQTVQAGAITIANAAPATSILAQGGGQVTVDDGLLDVTIATVESKLQAVTTLIGMFGSALVRADPQRPNVAHFSTRRIRVVAEPPQKVVLDGEIVGNTPVEIETIPQSLVVFTPPVITAEPDS
jgi:methylglyoxal synthase